MSYNYKKHRKEKCKNCEWYNSDKERTCKGSKFEIDRYCTFKKKKNKQY